MPVAWLRMQSFSVIYTESTLKQKPEKVFLWANNLLPDTRKGPQKDIDNNFAGKHSCVAAAAKMQNFNLSQTKL